MFVSHPLLAARNQVLQAIAASGVSWPDPETDDPRPSWRRQGRTDNAYLVPMPSCPECGGRLVHASACVTCPGCGWGRCT